MEQLKQYAKYLIHTIWTWVKLFLEDTMGLSAAQLHQILKYSAIAAGTLLFCFLLYRCYRIWLPGHIARRYKIGRLPKHAIIKRRRKNGHNSYALRFPYWRYANRDGCRDQRRKRNRIYWRHSCLVIDSYQIFLKNPVQMVRLVHRFREQGAVIEPCRQEQAKRNRLQMDQNRVHSVSANSAMQLYCRYQEKPYEFEQYCAALFRSMGKQAKVTPQSNDGGYDIILTDPDGQCGLVECKCYAPEAKIGRPMLQKLAGAAMGYPERVNYLVFITTSDFSEEAQGFSRDFLQNNMISFGLINGEMLVKLANEHFSAPEVPQKIISWQEWQLKPEDLQAEIPADIFLRL